MWACSLLLGSHRSPWYKWYKLDIATQPSYVHKRVLHPRSLYFCMFASAKGSPTVVTSAMQQQDQALCINFTQPETDWASSLCGLQHSSSASSVLRLAACYSHLRCARALGRGVVRAVYLRAHARGAARCTTQEEVAKFVWPPFWRHVILDTHTTLTHPSSVRGPPSALRWSIGLRTIICCPCTSSGHAC